MAPKSKTRINGACGSDGGVYRIQKRSGLSNLTKPHILIGLAIINYTAMNRIKIVLLVAILAATTLLKSQSLSITGCDTTMKYYTSEKFYGLRYGTQYDNWTETVKSTQFRLLDADICKINWVGAVNNPGWNEDAKSTWIWGYGFLGLVKPSDLQFANPGGIADGHAYFWKPIYCGFFICGYDWDYAYYELRYNYYSLV